MLVFIRYVCVCLCMQNLLHLVVRVDESNGLAILNGKGWEFSPL